mgnify:CR=1 FL=1
MKLKLTALCLVIGCIVFAQKQIEPYTFTEEGKTILIFGSPTTPNNVTFTLKNSKNEGILNKKGEKISFEVFPLNEVIFSNKLKEALFSINPNANEYGIIKDDITDDKYTKIARNIFQFFNALIITAFQYDTEPVAGTLNYSMNIVINKNNIEGEKTEDYFKKIAKKIEKKADKSEKQREENKKIINHQNTSFSDYAVDSFTSELKDYDRKLMIKKLKELYSNRIIEKLFEENLLIKYIDYTDRIESYQKSIEQIKKNIESLNLDVKSKQDSIDKTSNIIDSIHEKRAKIEYEKIYRGDPNYKDDEYDKLYNTRFELYRTRSKLRKELELLNLQKEYSENNTIKLKKIIEEIDSNLKLKEKEIRIKSEDIKNTRLVLRVGELQDEKKKLIEEKEYFTQKKQYLIKALNNSLFRIKELEDSIHRAQIDINSLIGKKSEDIRNFPFYNFIVKNIELDINDGFIEHISVTGKISTPIIAKHLLFRNDSIKEKLKESKKTLEQILPQFYNEKLVQEILQPYTGKILKFKNEYPIGFSSKFDFDFMYQAKLSHREGSEAIFSVPIGKIIKLYVQKHQNDRLDFSPKNQVISLPSDDIDKDYSLELKKEKSSKILSARVYSDFLGFKEKDPNGLIQFEIEKEIPLITKRVPTCDNGNNLGYLNYMNFDFNWTRIENREQELIIENDQLFLLDLIKYQNISIGLDANLFIWDLPNSKLRLDLNVGIHYARTKVINENPNKTINENIGSFIYYPDLMLRIRPEERFGGYLRFRTFGITTPGNFDGTDPLKPFSITDRKQWLKRFELSTFYAPSPKSDNKFFFRYRYTNTASAPTNGFNEFQIGYLMYLKF